MDILNVLLEALVKNAPYLLIAWCLRVAIKEVNITINAPKKRNPRKRK